MVKNKYLLVALFALLIFTNYNANAQWQSMGLNSKLSGLKIWEIDVHPTNPDIMLIGTDKGFWITTDGGANLSRSNLGMNYIPQSEIPDISRAPGDANIVYLASHNTPNDLNSGGVYKSTDGGITWKRLSGLQWKSVWSVTVHPSNSNWIFAATEDTKDGGIWKSEDGGNTFTQKLHYTGNNYVSKIAYDLSDPSRLVAGSFDGHLYYSADGGENWQGGFENIFNGKAIWEMEISQNNVLAGGSFTGLKRSADGGKTWTEVGFSSTIISHIKKVADEPGTVYWGTGDGEFYGSLDFGYTWKNATADLPGEITWVGGIARNKGWDRRLFIAVQPADVYYIETPSAPYDLVYKAIDSDSVRLTWKDSSEFVTYFDIEKDGQRGWAQVPAGTTVFFDTAVVEGLSYQYRVRSCLVTGIDTLCSPGSNEDGGPVPLNAPDDCHAKVLNCATIELTWNDKSEKEDGYIIERSPINRDADFVEIGTEGVDAESYIDETGLVPGNMYYYRIWTAQFNEKASTRFCNPRAFLSDTIHARIVNENESILGVPFTVTVFVDLTGTPILLSKFDASISWNATSPVLSYINAELQSGFEGTVNIDTTAGTIRFNGENSSGVGDIVKILTAEFKPVGSNGDRDTLKVNFSEMIIAQASTDVLSCLSVTNLPFEITESLFLGDVNGDALVDSSDAKIVLQFSAGLPISDNSKNRIDRGFGNINHTVDEITNSTDANIILTFALGLPVPFPIAEIIFP